MLVVGLVAMASRAAQPPAKGYSGGSSVRAGYLADWPPDYQQRADGGPGGLAVEVLDALGERLGIRIDYRPYPDYPAAVAALGRGEIDVLPSLGLAAGRQDRFLFTSSYETQPVSLFVRNSTTGVQNLADLQGARVGVIRSNVGVELASGQQGIVPVVFAQTGQALLALLAADIDGLIYPQDTLLELARRAGVESKIRIAGPPLLEVRRCMAVRRDAPALAERLDHALSAYVLTPEFRSSYRRWHPSPAPYWTTRRVLLVAGLVFALSVLAMALWRMTSMQRLNRRLAQQERRSRVLLDHLAEGVVFLDRARQVDYANESFARLVGQPVEELVGTPLVRFAADVASSCTLDQLLSESGEGPSRRQEARLSRRGGGVTVVEAQAATIVGDTKPEVGTLVSFTDVGERKLAEQRLRFEASLLETVGEAVIASDVEGRVTAWNRFAERLYGWSESEALGREIADLTPSDASRHEVEAIVTRVRAGETWRGEVELRRRDGSTFIGQVTETPIFDAHGEVVGAVSVSSDLTQERRIQDALRQAQKLEAVGRLAGGVAHDFNNLLTVILGEVELLLDEPFGGEAAHEALRSVRDQAERAANLTRQLLAIGRRQVLAAREIDAAEILRTVERLLRRALGENVRLEIDIADDRCPVVVDPAQFEQVLLNLAVNARDAMPSGGTLTITLDRVHLEAAAAMELHLEPGDFARIEVRDNGAGIPPEHLGKIFEPFFTTKGPEKGTGLGLAMVYGVVSQSGGWVSVESQPDRGTTFRILLPGAGGTSAPGLDESREPAGSPSGNETLLLVEDEEAVRSLLRRSLESHGYRVLAADDGPNALTLFTERGNEISALLTDVVMPEMSGIELARRLRAIRPDLPILMLSGHAQEMIDSQGSPVEGSRFLTKPVALGKLAYAVRSLLDGDNDSA